MKSTDRPWAAAASALDLVRGALVFRTLLVVPGIALVASMQLGASSFQTRHLLDCWLGIAETLVMLVAFVGVARFVTRTPDGHAGRAGFAPLCVGVALFAQTYRAWIYIQLVRGESGPIAGLPEHVARLLYLEVAVNCGSLLGLWSLIGGVVSVARALANDAVARRARAMSVVVGLLSGSFVALYYCLTARRPDDSAFIIWLVLAVLALGALFFAAGALAMASDAMRAGSRPALPGARVVSET